MGDLGLVELWILTAPLWAILCALVASSKNQNVGAWAVGGILFGFLAVIFLAIYIPNASEE